VSGIFARSKAVLVFVFFAVMMSAPFIFYDLVRAHLENRWAILILIMGIGLSLSSTAVVLLLLRSASIAASVARSVTQDLNESRHELQADEDEINKMNIMVAQSPAAILMTDANGSIEYVNPKFCDLTGYSAEEVLGKNPRILKSGMTRPEDYADLWRTITSGRTWKGELQNKKKNGEFCWVSESISPVKDPNGVITHFIDVQEDVTDKKKVEQLLQESEGRFRSIFEKSGDAIMTLDYPSGKLATANAATLRMFGVKSEREFVTLDPWSLSPATQPDGRASINKAQELIEKAVREGTYFFEWVHKRISGEEFPATVLLSKIDQPGKIVILATVRDVSKQKMLERQFMQAQKMETIGTLAGGVAHDLNNLLTVINGYSEMQVSALPPGDAVRADLEEIFKAGKRAEWLVKQLLVFSRKQIFEPKVIHLQELIQDMDKMFRRLIAENIDFVVMARLETWAVRVDPESFRQVLTNLVINSSHAMPRGGKIEIDARNVVLRPNDVLHREHPVPGEYLLLTVSDTGTGMSDEVKSHLFEPFFTTKEKGKGTGLGLSTVYGIVKQSDGYVQVDSELGRGATFKIYLPRAAAEPSPWYGNEVEMPLPQGTETVLVVEDEDAVRTYSVKALRSLGYDVLEASNGADALRLAGESRAKPIQLLFSDVVMPGMDGKELADRVRSLCPGIQVLLTSGYTDNLIIHSGNLKAWEAFLKKPYSLKSLSFKIREVLDRKRGTPAT